MQSFYTGSATFKGNIEKFRQWYIRSVQNRTTGKNFAKSFAPLSSNCKYAKQSEWGVESDFTIDVYDGLDEDDEEFSFTFKSLKNSPYNLWKQLETNYNIIVEEYGYPKEETLFCKYLNGKYITKNYMNIFIKKYDYPGEFQPSKKAENDKKLYNKEFEEWLNDEWYALYEKWVQNTFDCDN
jgi:hypothetical protein